MIQRSIVTDVLSEKNVVFSFLSVSSVRVFLSNHGADFLFFSLL